jgi:hypothetical protein
MKYCIIFIIAVIGITSVSAQKGNSKKNLQKFEGFFNFQYSEAEGKIYLEVNNLDKEFLYVHSLRTGLGSNDIGLDRGQLGGGDVVKFVKAGNKILLIQENMKYRASSKNILEKRSIEEAFAKSVLFGFDILERKGESFKIDLTPFILLDAHGVAQSLKTKKEGVYKLDKTRNAVWMERTKAFPENVEFESILTFVGEPSGKNLKTVAPNINSVSVIQHYSFVKLPENNYEPRVFDPRSGSNPMTYMDYSTPIWEPITKRYINRHHLEKKDKNSITLSEAVEPIIYYLDPGTPEPVRSALLEGASWWNQAFESIGYKDAFQVKLLPADADPMDVRYNVIQWVHRSTRGWSYGATITDPRTGEIIKGHVSLGSLRIRQDYMIAQALMNKPFAKSDTNYDQMLELALARIRQLSAHEVGHTLGFAHNFAASTNNRASVMDYPHPTLSLKNGEIDFSNAYDVGIGAWDKITVAYSYGDIPEGVDEKEHLSSILESSFSEGMRFISDSDARSPAGAHGKAHLWDNGINAAEELVSLLEIRAVAMANFSEDNIRSGEPYSVLEDVFVPLFFLHRFQVEAAVKSIAGLDYNYAVKGDQELIVEILPKEDQKQALEAVLTTLHVDILAIPEDKLKLFPPRAFSYARTRESFKSTMGVSFDALGAAATASNLTLELLLNPDRMNRLVQQKSIDVENIGAEDVLTELIKTVFSDSNGSKYENEIQHTIQYVTLQQLFSLALNNNTIPQIKGIVHSTIDILYSKLEIKQDTFSKQLLREISNFREDPEEFNRIIPPVIPDGSPIGSFECFINN